MAVSVALVELAAAAVMGRHGSYTQKKFDVSIHAMRHTFDQLVQACETPLLILLIGMLLLGITTQHLKPVGRTPISLLIGGLMYALNLVPGTTAGGYYSVPVMWLLSVGVLIPVPRSWRRRDSAALRFAAAAVAAVTCLSYVTPQIRWYWHQSRTQFALTRWALKAPRGSIIAIQTQVGGELSPRSGCGAP